jgi:serine/threonine protein kinase
MQFDQRSGSPAPLEPGSLFGSGSEYRLVARLGRGGMGEVWKAERRSAGGHVQKVAVKFLADAGRAAALDVEALRMSLLSHDNIVPFVDSGCDQEGRFFVAMTFVEGMDLDGLRRMIGLEGEAAYQVGHAAVRVPEQIVGFVLFMVLRALEYAHTFDFGGGVVGLVHRDISPGNILLDERRGFVKLSDFGVAVVSGDAAGQRQIAGKVPYMAPEVLVGDLADARSDIYALGLVAYELATGFNPNVRPALLKSVIGTVTEVMLSVEKPLVPAHEVVEGVSPAFSEIVARLLERDPAARYQTAAEALDQVSVYLFEKGFGPTTASLVKYFEVMREPERKLEPQERGPLRFLDWRRGMAAVRPPWTLTEAAARAVAAGSNPARLERG